MNDKKEKEEEIKKQELYFEARKCYEGDLFGYQVVLVANKEEKNWTDNEKETYKEIERAAIAEEKTFTYTIGFGVTTNDISAKALNMKEGDKITLKKLTEVFSKKIKELKEKDAKLKKEEEKKERELKEKQKNAIKKAKQTGEEVYIRTIGGYDGDEVNPERGMGWVNIIEVATPDGRIIEKEDPCY